MTGRSTRRSDLALTVLAPAAWGLTYLATTEFLPPHRPLLAGAARALPAGLILAAIARQRPHGLWWIKAAVLGLLNIGAFFALLFVAAYRLPGGVAATLGAVQPLVAAGLATVLLHERLRSNTIIAGTLGIVGVALLVLRAGARLDTLGLIAGLAGAASMATGTVLTKRWGRPTTLTAFTAWQLIAGGLALTPLALVIDGLPSDLTARNIIGFTWLATGGTAVAYLLWFRGIARLPVSHVSLLGLASPLVATASGWIALHQTLTTTQLLGATLALTALWYGQRPGTTDEHHSTDPLARHTPLARLASSATAARARRQGRSRMTAIVSRICDNASGPTLPTVSTTRAGDTARTC